MSDLVCISHLRWDFVWQRPQQLLARLAQTRRVLFVEEPVTRTEVVVPYLEVFPANNATNVTVLRLVQPAPQNYWIGHGDPRTQPAYSRLLKEYLQAEGYVNPVLWMYTPMGSEFVDEIGPGLLVYDVMDQLAAFKGAPPHLLEREKQLLRRADLVFTGGVSLYRDKLPFNENTYLFPSGVEIEHFAKAARPDAFTRPDDLPDPQEGQALLGYYGVIDERMDLALLAYLAQARPHWQIIMLGPLAKINRADLPQAANLHYLGMKSYKQLPTYLAYFDVALIPFALNQATRYLSPTKTLEYMAAQKPVVSNPIADVVELYGEVVRVAYSRAEFVAQVEAALQDKPPINQAKAAELLTRYTWDSIAAQMGQLIETEAEASLKAENLAKV